MATPNSSTANRTGKTAKPKKTVKDTGPITDLIRRVTLGRNQSKRTLPDFQTGDTVGVYVKVKEGEKERVQLFAGVVLKIQGSGSGRSFTVRKVSSGVGVERTFPLLSPAIDRVEIVSRGKVRRSRLFFLRGLKGRSARLDSEVYFADGEPSGAGDDAKATAGADGAVDAKADAKSDAKPAKGEGKKPKAAAKK